MRSITGSGEDLECLAQGYAITGFTGSANNPTLVREECSEEKIGEPIPGKDVAILKMKGSNFPTVTLAPSVSRAGIRTGSDIYIVGFPGQVAVSATFSKSSIVEPSQTSGRVSALRDVGQDRWKVVETDATINHGNSGGPAFDENGSVIGLATFSLVDQPGINYIVSVDVLNEFLDTLHVKPAMSDYTRKYLEALDAKDNNQPGLAITLFRELQAQRKGVKVVDEYVQSMGGDAPVAAPVNVRTAAVPAAAASAASPRKPGSQGPILLFGVFAGFVLVVMIVVVMANRD